MAYVLGFFVADGNMMETNRGTYFISFYSADRELIQTIKKAMGSGHKISERKSDIGSVFRIQIGSKEIFEDFLNLGLCPSKSHRIEIPNVPRKFVKDFIRGYFDGDGNVWVGYVNKYRKKPTLTIQVSFTSVSYDFLSNFLGLLCCGGVKGGYIYRSKTKNFSRISLSILDSLKLYELMYNVPCHLFLKRKKVVFEKFIKMRS